MEKNNKKKPFDFWNDHSLEFLEMSMKRDFQETVTDCDGYGKSVRKDCGDTIEFFINHKDGVVETISYDLKGCLFSHACANTVIELARGRTLKEADRIISRDIVVYLKTLPEKEIHCADHALAAFRAALKQASGKK